MVTNATVKPIETEDVPFQITRSETATEKADLVQLTKSELIELAEANGVEAKPTMKKAELIEALQGAGL